MRLVTFERRGNDKGQRRTAPRLGALLGDDQGDDVVDLNRAFALQLELEDVGAPEAEADSLLPGDLLRFLRKGQRAFDVARRTVDWVLGHLQSYDGPDLTREQVVHAGSEVKLCAPLEAPGKILVFGKRDRATELDVSLGVATSIAGPGDDIVIPAAFGQVRCVGDLVVVIGSVAHSVSADAAKPYIAGYCVGIDVRAAQFEGRSLAPWQGGWSDTFTPLGPALVTADTVPDSHDLSLRTLVSGERTHDASTKEMSLSVAEVVSLASQVTTLEPGDLIFTGAGRLPEDARELRDGDVVDVAIEHLGQLRSYVRNAG